MFVRNDVDDRIAATAAAQHGVVHRRQIYEAGADRALLARRVHTGRLIHLGCEVYGLAGATPTLDRRRWIALLAAGPGAHLSHEAAAELHRINGVKRGLVVVTAAHPHHVDLPGATLHQLDDVAAEHLVRMGQFPVTTAARTIIDLAAVVSWIRLATALEDVVVQRRCTLGQVADVLRGVRRRGKPGVAKLASVLAAREGEPPPASVLERKLLHAAAAARVSVIRQFPLPWAREPVKGVVDAAVVDSRVILEADGRRWHARLQQMGTDRQRDVTAARAGWLTLRFVHEDFAYVPAVAAAIRDVHRSRVPA